MDLPKYPFAMATDKRHGQVLALRGMRETPIHAGIVQWIYVECQCIWLEMNFNMINETSSIVQAMETLQVTGVLYFQLTLFRLSSK